MKTRFIVTLDNEILEKYHIKREEVIQNLEARLREMVDIRVRFDDFVKRCNAEARAAR